MGNGFSPWEMYNPTHLQAPQLAPTYIPSPWTHTRNRGQRKVPRGHTLTRPILGQTYREHHFQSQQNTRIPTKELENCLQRAEGESIPGLCPSSIGVCQLSMGPTPTKVYPQDRSNTEKSGSLCPSPLP